jgi:hypothetical protein
MDRSDSIETDNAELLTPRDLRRDLTTQLDRLTGGEVEKLVLLQSNQMVAVVLPLETYVGLLKKGEG